MAAKNGQKGKTNPQAFVCRLCGLSNKTGPQCRGCNSLASKAVITATRLAEQSGEPSASTRGGPQGVSSAGTRARRSQGGPRASARDRRGGGAWASTQNRTHAAESDKPDGYGGWAQVGKGGRPVSGKGLGKQGKTSNSGVGKGWGNGPRSGGKANPKGKPNQEGYVDKRPQPSPQGMPQPQFKGRTCHAPKDIPPDNARMLQLEKIVADLRAMVEFARN